MNDNLWKDQAACDVTIHGDLWFRPAGEVAGPKRRERIKEAENICATCPVIGECARASVNEREGIWAGRDLDEPDPVPEPVPPKPRKKRAGKPADSENGRRASASATAAQQRRFDHTVETMTALHHNGVPFNDILTQLGTSAHALRRRLRRRDRLDLYSMLTGAATT